MFVLNPDPYSLPAYRIGPFRTADLGFNHNLPLCDKIDDYFGSRFYGKPYSYTANGRQAINIALTNLGLVKSDVVTILTTTNNFYISGCVTTEIEKFCKWSRVMTSNTKAIFVNHEFGYPYPDLHRLKAHNLPIIEDCAGSFFSKDTNNDIGNIGDYVIYSFPKMFPLQIGGLLLSNTFKEIEPETIDDEKRRYIKNVLSYYIDSENEIVERRLYNYEYLKRRFESLGFKERFTTDNNSVPSVFMFKTDNRMLNLPDLKNFFYAHGVQCSVFYGEEAFFIPVHQSLNEHDLQYFFEIARYYLTTIK